ncbi:hypothetical protein L484_000060 [Morus notabilis]|uniref:RNase H type-1 domain-containing protein n=1 Tax=Morus notabilis TaxID=981085 RepID=W9SFL8_9ROSA|nr:hypothetical protein L484_013862 [Morus notabilis]EXC63850.1 hypothetical protein L484_000060 [Morus notabilis]
MKSRHAEQAGLGVILFSSHGVVEKVWTDVVLAISSLEAEFLAVKLAIEVGIEFGSPVLIHVDCKEFVQSILDQAFSGIGWFCFHLTYSAD